MWVPPAYWQNRLIVWCPHTHIIVPSSSCTHQNTGKYLWLTLTAACNHIQHSHWYISIPGPKSQKGFLSPPPISEKLLLLRCGEITSVWEVFSNQQLRKGSRIGVELVSVFYFKNVMCFLFLLYLLEAVGEYLMSFTLWCSHFKGFCGAGPQPWGSAYG